jgi:hypothetical protein
MRAAARAAAVLCALQTALWGALSGLPHSLSAAELAALPHAFLNTVPMPSDARSYRALSVGAFFTGLAVVAWVASGFVGTSAFALGMTLLIGAVYLGGAWELRRFGQSTAGLNAALARVPQPLPQLADWLATVPAPLQPAVRQRIEAERSAFPGLALTPYLIGLLVMLGMLGTFLGMVVTFKGAVFALEGSADLNAIRAALAAPIKGLGLSFGTSVAGVATSAMLGLMATLARRERTQALRALDALAATTLAPFTPAFQRQQSFAALQRQAEAMPAAAQHLQTLIEQLERRNQQLDEALLARQADFQREAAAAYTGLAQSVGQSLRESLAASARAATDSLQPVVQQAMAGIAAESSRLHEGVSAAVQAQLDGLSARFSATTATVADTWARALAQHEQGGQQLLQGLSQSLAAFNTGFDERSAQLLARVEATQTAARTERAQAEQAQQAALTDALERMAHGLKTHWQQAGEQTLAQQRAVLQALEQTATAITERSSEQAGRSLDGVNRLIAQTEALVQARAASEAAWTEQHGQRMDQLAALWRSELAALRSEEAQRADAAVQRNAELQTRLAGQLASLQAGATEQLATLQSAAAQQLAALQAGVAQRLDALHSAETSRQQAQTEQHHQTLAALAQQLQTLRDDEAARQQAAAEHQARQQAALAQQLAQLQSAAGQQMGSLQADTAQRLDALHRAEAERQQALVAQHSQAFAALAQQLQTLRDDEARRQQASAEQQTADLAALAQQLQALRADEAARGDAAVQRLADLQAALASQLATLGTALEAPMARLMHTASEAPKAAAEVIAQLREQMSRLAERDNATLTERAELVGQIGTLLQQVQQTTGEQRAAIEHLVGSATTVLDRVGQQFADTVGAQAGRAEAMAEQAATSAAQLASLGDAFQQGTQQLAASHEQLVSSLQRVEGAIGQSLARSDEQLAYYVAQAREVIDLSISAQQGIVEDLRQLRNTARANASALAGAA